MAVLFCDAEAWGDVFILQGGGTVRGRWVNHEQQPLVAYVVETEQGGRVTLAKSQVKQAIRRGSAEMTYEQLAPEYGDTVESQWELAEWCREQGLDGQREVHLQRILELEEDHAAARRGLGYSRLQGQWVRRQDYLQQQGYELYRGGWKMAQEIQLLEEDHKRDLAEKEWINRLRRWRAALRGDGARQAWQQIQAIEDPHAIKGLGEQLKKERYRPVKLLYVEVLGGIPHGDAIRTLIDVSLNDPDVEVFHACLDEIVSRRRPATSGAYAQALKDANNVRINRAATALGRLQDRSVIVPLIDALVSSHQIQISNTSPETVTSTFLRDGGGPGLSPMQGGGLSTGASSNVVTVQVPNQDVLNALVKLCDGVSFGYNQQAWRYWHALENKKLPQAETRRD